MNITIIFLLGFLCANCYALEFRVISEKVEVKPCCNENGEISHSGKAVIYFPGTVVKLIKTEGSKLLIGSNSYGSWIDSKTVISEADFKPINSWPVNDDHEFCYGDTCEVYSFFKNGTYKYVSIGEVESKPVFGTIRKFKNIYLVKSKSDFLSNGNVFVVYPNGEICLGEDLVIGYCNENGKVKYL